MKAWLVKVNEPASDGEGLAKDFWFQDYDDAHAFYVKVKAKRGEPFHPTVIAPPDHAEVPTPKIHGFGEMPKGYDE